MGVVFWGVSGFAYNAGISEALALLGFHLGPSKPNNGPNGKHRPTIALPILILNQPRPAQITLHPHLKRTIIISIELRILPQILGLLLYLLCLSLYQSGLKLLVDVLFELTV